MITLKYCVLATFIIFLNLNNYATGYLAQLAARLPLKGTPSPPGSLWPLPKFQKSELNVVGIGAKESFKYSSNVNDCEILNKAFERYSWDFLFKDLTVSVGENLPLISNIDVEIATGAGNLCTTFPKLDTDNPDYEAYNLSVSGTGLVANAKITARTVWGALRGLETFSQLIWKDPESNQHYVNVTELEDSPRYPHRGIMIDSARHYLDIPVILKILDGMSYNKLNVMHWHMVDDQSFPFVSRKFPQLSEKGAYLPELTYEPEEVQSVMEYARDRGIRVILEFDTPGHTVGFGKAYPDLITPCFGDGENPGTANFPIHAAYEILDPTKQNTYDFMREFFTEIYQNVTKDEYIHLGMDEVYYACWESSPLIKAFMDENGYTEMYQVQQHYTERHLEMVQSLGAKPMIWQDPIDFGVRPDPNNVLIQVWKGNATDPWQVYFEKVITAGYQVILSSCWYLNYVSYGETWRQYYECDPVLSLENFQLTPEQEKLILGGEAAVFGEYVDGSNVISRFFPYVGAVAETLWSPMNSSTTDDAMYRLDEHRCRMLWRGISAQPIFNGYCHASEKTRGGNSNGGAMSSYTVQKLFLVLFVSYLIFM